MVVPLRKGELEVEYCLKRAFEDNYFSIRIVAQATTHSDQAIELTNMKKMHQQLFIHNKDCTRGGKILHPWIYSDYSSFLSSLQI